MQGHLSSERLYTNSVFGSSDINKIETRLYQEMAERVVASPSTPPPESSGDWLYYQADQSNHSYAVFVRKRVVNASQPQPEEQVILDTSALPQPSDGRPLLIGSMQISRDHTYACFTVDSTGGEVYSLWVVNMQSADPPVCVADGVVSAVWVGGASSAAAANDFSLGPKKDPPCTSSPHAFPALVYTTADSSGRPDRVLALSLAHLPPKRPRVLLSENDAGFLCHLHVTKDTNFLQLASASKSCTALWVD